MPKTAPLEDYERWRAMKARGKSVAEIAIKEGRSISAINRGIRRAAELAEEGAEEASVARRPPFLVLDFGNSSKPFARLTCYDIHPCRECDTTGRVLRITPVEVVDTSGLVTVESVPLPIECPACGGSGLAEYRPGSMHLCCADCHRSGIDSHPLLSRTGTLSTTRDGHAKANPTRYRRGRLKGGVG